MADSTIAWLASWTPTTDDLLVFYDNADGTTKQAPISALPTSSWANTALSNLASVAINTALLPWVSDSIALGSTALQWSDLHLWEGWAINWDNGDATLTQVGNVVTLAWANLVTDTTTVNTSLLPDANDGATLWAWTTAFSDLFLAEWGVINWDNGDATITQTANDITVAGITTFGVWTSTAVTLGTIEVGAASDTTISRSSAWVIAVESVVIPSISSTNTLTNKRVTRRVTATASPWATPTINTDNCDVVHFTTVNAAITSMTTNLTGTPVDGDMLRISFTDNWTARAITWWASFESSTVALPTTTVISTRLDVGFIWNTEATKWRCVAVA